MELFYSSLSIVEQIYILCHIFIVKMTGNSQVIQVKEKNQQPHTATLKTPEIRELQLHSRPYTIFSVPAVISCEEEGKYPIYALSLPFPSFSIKMDNFPPPTYDLKQPCICLMNSPYLPFQKVQHFLLVLEASYIHPNFSKNGL